MLIGHLGLAMGLKAWVACKKREGPGYGLAPWFGAVLFADLVCFPLALLGVEIIKFEAGFTRHFPYRAVYTPYTHSFAGTAALSVLVAVTWVSLRKFAGKRRASRKSGSLLVPALVLGAGVFSHWPLDLIVHGPDMSWAFEPPALGFALWNYPVISESLEVLMLSAGSCLVLWAHPGLMHWRFKAMLGVLLVAEFVPSLTPPVTDAFFAAVAGLSSMSGLVLLGWWGGRVPARSRS